MNSKLYKIYEKQKNERDKQYRETEIQSKKEIKKKPTSGFEPKYIRSAGERIAALPRWLDEIKMKLIV